MTNQRTKNIALMDKVVTVTLTLITCLDRYAMHLDVEWSKVETLECWSRDTFPVGISAIALFLYMPRARGQPHKGAAWYAFDSCRKWQKKFKKALDMACTRRIAKLGRTGTPPMVYVEEIVLDEPI
jgi:hypothetical protein